MVPPEINFAQSVVRLPSGNTLRLSPEVRVRDPSRAEYRWLRNDGSVQSKAVVYLNTLTISDLSKDDEGYYELSVTEDGQTTRRRCYVEVIVYQTPSPVVPVTTVRPGKH